MYVMEGVSYERSDGSWQKIEVGVDDSDFERQARQWGLDPDALSEQDRHAVLAALAEMLVFSRMKVARVHDSEWLEREAKPQADQIRERLRTLAVRLKA